MRSAEEDREFMASITRVRRMFSLGLGAMAFLWLIVIPAADVWQRYDQARLEAQIRLALVADRLSAFIAANLDIWEFEGLRLPSVAQGALRGGSHSPLRLAFVANSGAVVEFLAREGGGGLSLHVEDEVSDGRQVVGRVVMDVPLGDALRPALLSAAIGLGSMGLLLFLARLIGRNALDRSLAVISDTAARLAHRVDELEDARRQLAEHSASLQMANQDITHVALLTTHHLREPLRTILSYSQLLMRWHDGGESRDKADEYLGFLRGGVTRMQDQLKALSGYLGLRERTTAVAPVPLDEPLRQAVSRVGGIRLEAGPLPTVLGEGGLLADLFADLLAHTLRFRRPDMEPAVSASVIDHGDGVEIRLADNGFALTARDPDRMFHLLVHAKDGGMTKGLAQARLQAFLMGGALWAEPLGEAGVCFCIRLPKPSPPAAGP